MDQHLDNHKNKITGTLSTFDRMIFKGHILPFFCKSKTALFFISRKRIIQEFWFVR